ncbi:MULTISPECIES: TIGR04282 family arsenosugar biosynthesis glycosyltransferase [Prochlorococcus]|nr:MULTISPECIES: TIGR04282 family arsenosugar biosynthesis glycosyltransferase [Prochlorococcus]
MTRWPAPSRCKTRLAKDIGPYRAALIQQRLIHHTIAVAKAIKLKGLIETKLAIDGIGNQRVSAWARNEGFSLACSQGSGNLGLKMKRQLVLAQRKSTSKSQSSRDTILIGTDVPSLCTSDIDSALNSLKNNDLVIGPANDGGYWLIGFSKNILSPVISWPFSGIKWGTTSVFKETLRKAKEEGVNYKLLNRKDDLDFITDLSLWNI